MNLSPLLHLGGIDEIGVFVIPVLLAILALRWAERRARRKDDAEASEMPTRGSKDDSVLASPQRSDDEVVPPSVQQLPADRGSQGSDV